MATTKRMALAHDREFGVAGPLDVNYGFATHRRQCMPWTVLRESDAIVRRQPAHSDKLSQGFFIDGAESHAAD
jgi:hypothetical protein